MLNTAIKQQMLRCWTEITLSLPVITQNWKKTDTWSTKMN